MAELLAPAGSFEALVAAISNGADAIYLGMTKFGARAYADNFDLDNLIEAVNYAHLRKVKIYVTVNTIIFQDELNELYQLIDKLYYANVDGLIIQDLAVFNYVVKNYPLLEAHCSTQMGIDDLEGTLLFKELGAKRVVLSREVEISKIKQIKKIAQIPLEIFIHGALCVSYSGNCLMSGLIGYRSGNRGRCVGSCRKEYTLIDKTNDKEFGKSYLLSMKDLNTIDNIENLKDIDSLKIEGRMKEPAYVANVVANYRLALDGKKNPILKENLTKTFNRSFTKGYIFGEDKKVITNIIKPNNFGYLIGKITGKTKVGYQITLDSELNQNDIIRIDHSGEDINLTTTRIYDKNDNYISKADKQCYLKIKENLSIGDLVYKTKDSNFYETLNKSYPKEYRRFPIILDVYAYYDSPLKIVAKCEGISVEYTSSNLLQKALKLVSDEEMFFEQFNRLNDSVYFLEKLNYFNNEVFIPAKLINEARREIITSLNQKRLWQRKTITLNNNPTKKISFPIEKTKLVVYATTIEQYEAAKECGIEIIYYDNNVIRRNDVTYPPKNDYLLVGGYGGIYAYRNKNEIISDFSLNVVNAEAVKTLHSLGVKRVTLSHEINKKQIQNLINAYYLENDGYPNLEMVVYGRAHLLFTKYCPLKPYNLCGKCKTNNYVLKDEYEEFPIISHPDCTTTLVNSKILNLIDEINDIANINVFRLQFTTETKEETIKVIKQFQDTMTGKIKTKQFNQSTDTRGHFNKEIL